MLLLTKVPAIANSLTLYRSLRGVQALALGRIASHATFASVQPLTKSR